MPALLCQIVSTGKLVGSFFGPKEGPADENRPEANMVVEEIAGEQTYGKLRMKPYGQVTLKLEY